MRRWAERPVRERHGENGIYYVHAATRDEAPGTFDGPPGERDEYYDDDDDGSELMLMHPSDLFKNRRNVVPNKLMLMPRRTAYEANICFAKQKKKRGEKKNVT